MTTRFSAPEGSLLRREMRAVREPFRLLRSAAALRAAPRGSVGVVVLPGYSTSDTVMTPLRRFLASRGHRVWGWGLGKNRGDVAGNLHSVIEQIENRWIANGRQPLHLVGWSLGGVFAREVARDRPELVEQVITMATPIYGGPKFTVSARDYSAEELDRIEARIAARNARLIEQPITAFYSRLDGAIDWRTTLDDLDPNVEHIEVNSSHLGITLDPTVWLGVASRLTADL